MEPLVIGLRALAFLLVLQAAGIALFLTLFDDGLISSAGAVRSLGKHLAIGGMLATAALQVSQPVLMAGAFAGVFDASLQAIALQSDLGVTHAVRLLGLLAIVSAVAKKGRIACALAATGSVLVAASFAFMGHTVPHELRWFLAPLLILHVLVVAFWFGSLLPLYAASIAETATSAGRLIERFSAVASRLVPLIFLAGLAMAVGLLPDLASVQTAYGYSIVAKMTGFAVLMLLAAANKWRFGPRIAAGQLNALPSFRRAVLLEATLISGVVIVTAVMTALFSVNH